MGAEVLTGFFVRRLFAGLVTLLVTSFLMFLMVAVSGDPLARLKANPHVSAATIAAARKELGLDQPLLLRYWSWLTHVLTGSFGISTSSSKAPT